MDFVFKISKQFEIEFCFPFEHRLFLDRWEVNFLQLSKSYSNFGLSACNLASCLRSSYVPNPVLVIIDVQPKELGIPTKAYCAVEEVKENATQKSQKVFVHVPSEFAAHEVEEIGETAMVNGNKEKSGVILAKNLILTTLVWKGCSLSHDPGLCCCYQ